MTPHMKLAILFAGAIPLLFAEWYIFGIRNPAARLALGMLAMGTWTITTALYLAWCVSGL